MMQRRNFLMGLGAALVCAPAVIRTPGLLMPIRPWREELNAGSIEDLLRKVHGEAVGKLHLTPRYLVVPQEFHEAALRHFGSATIIKWGDPIEYA